MFKLLILLALVSVAFADVCNMTTCSAIGGPCNDNGLHMCGSGYCRNKICVNYIAVGGYCNTTGNLLCDGTGGMIATTKCDNTNHCVALKAPGSACTDYSDCILGDATPFYTGNYKPTVGCINSVCKILNTAAIGAVCNATAQCTFDAYCAAATASSGICTARIADAGTCTPLQSCKFGSDCFQGTCNKYLSQASGVACGYGMLGISSCQAGLLCPSVTSATCIVPDAVPSGTCSLATQSPCVTRSQVCVCMYGTSACYQYSTSVDPVSAGVLDALNCLKDNPVNGLVTCYSKIFAIPKQTVTCPGSSATSIVASISLLVLAVLALLF